MRPSTIFGNCSSIIEAVQKKLNFRFSDTFSCALFCAVLPSYSFIYLVWFLSQMMPTVNLQYHAYIFFVTLPVTLFAMVNFFPLTILLVFLKVSLLLGQTSESTISGIVTDAQTGEAIPGVTLRFSGTTQTGTVTNAEGFYSCKLKLGMYSVTLSCIGYLTVVKTDIVIQAARNTVVNTSLTASQEQLSEVVVTADYFDKSSLLNTLSAVSLNPEEIRRSPGSAADFQRILQGMPGVGFSNDQNNELLVRGGDPNENLFLFDNIELHSVNHYPNQMNSGGPISMVNVDLIREIKFSTGGFQAKYGNKLSSVIEIESREGNRLAPLGGTASFSFAGIGAVAEGGFDAEKGSWLVSFKKSYLDLIIGPIGITAVPKYYDAQWKAVYDLSQRHTLSFSGIYGNDKIDISGADDHENFSRAGSADTLTLDNIDVKQHQYAYGITLKSFWSKNVFGKLSLSGSKYHYQLILLQDLNQFQYNNLGASTAKTVLSQQNMYTENTDEEEFTAKAEFRVTLSPQLEIELGGAVKTGAFNGIVFAGADTARYDLNNDGVFETGPIVRKEATSVTTISVFDEYKSYAYFSQRLKLFNDKLLVTAGIRYDYFTYSGAADISPRFSLSWFIFPGQTSVNVGYGVYHQNLAYPLYGDRYSSGVNKSLPNTSAEHFILGVEHIPAPGLMLNLETYYKRYDKLPLREEFIFSDDVTFRSEKNLAIGRRYAYGVDLVVQQKMAVNLYGTIALSYSRSRDADMRRGKEGAEYTAPYEFPVMATVVMGKRFSGLRTELHNSHSVLQYLSYLLPFSDDMEISFRWRYASGSPHTPQEYISTKQIRSNGITWTRGVWERISEVKSGRFPDYHRLDIGFNSRYNFETWSLTVTLSLQNIYNRKNVAGYTYYDDGTKQTVYQFSFLPVAGIEAAF